jgi:3-oxoacyl-[acyl-carrier protein] reductase
LTVRAYGHRPRSAGRYDRVEEIASAAAILANPESAFINGKNHTVDGEWNAESK